MKPVVGVIGPASTEYPADRQVAKRMEGEAEEVGRLLAKGGAVVLTGGMDGIMEAAGRGAKAGVGLTVGTPGRARGSSNRFTDIEILTPIGIGDFLFAGSWTCDSLVVFPGGAGTMAELCLAYRLKKPIIIMKGYDRSYDRLAGGYMDNGKLVRLMGASSPQEAARTALQKARQNIKKAGEL